MHLAVVIPTRNRAGLAITAVESVLDQRVPEISVIVSDNSTEPEESHRLEAFVQGLGDSAVRYVQPVEPLPMASHWDWAMTCALADPAVTHVGYLTDRMVFRRDCLPLLLAMIEDHPGRILAYNHDDLIDHARPVRLHQHPRTSELMELDAQHLLDLGAGGEFPHALPRMLNCLVPRDVVEVVRDRFGSVFASVSPDYCFAFRSLDAVDSILYFDESCLVNYALDRSHGFSYTRGLENRDRREFVADLAGAPMHVSTPLPEFETVMNSVFNEYFFVLSDPASNKLRRVRRHAYLNALAEGMRLLEDDHVRTREMERLAGHGWRWRGGRARGWLDRRATLIRFFARRPGTLLRRLAGLWQRTPPGRLIWRLAIALGATPPSGGWLEFPDRTAGLERARDLPPRRTRDFAHLPNLVEPPGVAQVLDVRKLS